MINDDKEKDLKQKIEEDVAEYLIKGTGNFADEIKKQEQKELSRSLTRMFFISLIPLIILILIVD